MTLSGADILAGMCNRIAPLNVTFRFAASGGRSIGEGILTVASVLSGKRDLSMTMVRRLRERFHISADLLVPRGRTRNRITA